MGSSLAVSTYNDVQKELERRGLAGTYDIDAAILDARQAALADLHDRLNRRGIPPLDHPSFRMPEPPAADDDAGDASPPVLPSSDQRTEETTR